MSSASVFATSALVRLLAPDEGPDRDLVEEPPDEHVAHARVGELLEPARAGAIGDVGG